MADKAPNAQVVLANERTFLAWIRTSLALVATGVALEAFDVPIPPVWRQIAASILLLLGIAAALQAWIGWKATDAAASSGERVPPPVTRTLMVIGVVAAIAIVAVGLIVE